MAADPSLTSRAVPEAQSAELTTSDEQADRDFAEITGSRDSSEHEKQICGDVKPLDGGYGWCVVLGCFISHVVLGGLDRSEGVFFLCLLSQFGQSAQLTSWPGAIVCTLQLVMGPVANLLSNRYSVRTSVMLGAVLMFSGQLLSSFAPNLYVYFVCHSFIGGVGRGFAYVPGLVIVGMYFDKRAGLAAGLATSGAGVGAFVIVPLSQFMVDYYGFQGIFLILAAFACHVFVAAMLYRPISVHHQYLKLVDWVKVTVPSDDVIDEIETREIQATSNVQTEALLNECTQDASSDCRKTPSVCKLNTRDNRLHNSKMNCLLVSLKICFPTEHRNRQSKKRCSFYLLKNISLLMFCISIFIFTMAFRSAFIFLPALIESKGIPKSRAALALSTAGAVDTFGRIAAGFFLDLPKVRPLRLILYNMLIFGVALVAFLLPTFSSFPMFCLMSGCYGLLTGAYISQKSVVLADILDSEHVSDSFGILNVFQGMGNLLGPPLSGALSDLFGNFNQSFYLGGGLLLVAGVLMGLCNIFNLVEKRKLIRH